MATWPVHKGACLFPWEGGCVSLQESGEKCWDNCRNAWPRVLAFQPLNSTTVCSENSALIWDSFERNCWWCHVLTCVTHRKSTADSECSETASVPLALSEHAFCGFLLKNLPANPKLSPFGSVTSFLKEIACKRSDLHLVYTWRMTPSSNKSFD